MNIEKQLQFHYRESRESETLLINQMSLAMQSENKSVYKFGFGQSPFPVPSSVVDAMATAAYRKEYMAVQGDPSLRMAVANFHNKIEQRAWHSDDVIIGSGSKILLFCIMASFARADILLPSPSWVSYAPQADLAGHDVHWLNTCYEKAWKITADDIEQMCQNIDDQRKNNLQTSSRMETHGAVPKILVLNYPGNPTGQTYSDTELKALAFALRKHSVLVIADEIYSFLSFSNVTAHLEHHYPEGVLTTSGLSKWCGAGGWRIGYVHVPKTLPELKKRIIGVASETYSCAAAPIQVAATEAYSDMQGADKFLLEQKNILNKMAMDCVETMRAAGIKVHPSEGGFYLFPDFSEFSEKLAKRGIRDSNTLMKVILEETGVALLPGTAFGMPCESLTGRLAYVDFNGAKALKAPSDPQVFAHSREGMNRLCKWCAALT